MVIWSETADSPECSELAGALRRFVESPEVQICEFEDIFRGSPPRDIAAAFACVDSMRALEGARKLHSLNIPTVMISGSPDYAMEGIRLDVRHYIIRPVTEAEIQAALQRLGISTEGKPARKDSG